MGCFDWAARASPKPPVGWHPWRVAPNETRSKCERERPKQPKGNQASWAGKSEYHANYPRQTPFEWWGRWIEPFVNGAANCEKSEPSKYANKPTCFFRPCA